MSSYWDAPGVATIRIKMIYWRKQLESGREDPKALEKYARYSCEWEAVKEERKAARQKKLAERRAAAAVSKKKVIVEPVEWKPLNTIAFD